jgi:hypothetical protein
MTLPDERARSVAATEKFLRDLCDPKATPRVPRLVRTRALRLLRHYPTGYDMSLAALHAPQVFDVREDPLQTWLRQGKDPTKDV